MAHGDRGAGGGARGDETIRALIEGSPLAIVTFDPQGRITTWNPAAERMFGWSAGEAIGRFHPIVPEDKWDEFLRFRDRAMRGEAFADVEVTRRRKDGSPIDISFSTAPLKDSEGRITGIMSIIADITERKHAAESLLRLATAIEQVAEAIVITDTDGTIVYVNPAFESVTGYGRDEALGQNPRILKSGRHDEDFYRAMWDTIGGGEVWTGTFLNRRKDGGHYEEEAIISPVRDASGRVANYVAVKRDVTYERRMEEQLRQSQKMEVIGRLAGGIAHDFNNLMTAVTGYSELLLNRVGETDPVLRRDLQEIRKAGQRAASLTQQLLAFSRRQVMQPRVIDLNAAVAAIEKMMRPLIGEHIELVADLSPGLGMVKADPGQIEQVLSNLVINASDAMPGGGRLTIGTSNVVIGEKSVPRQVPAVTGPYVMLTVSDTGCGMDEETLSHLFEPFFTTKEVGKGTGLGLSTVYGIVKQSGGYVWAQSDLGRGTTFRVCLPRVDEPVPEVAMSRAGEDTVSRGRGRETILVVEDEPMVRELVREILQENGYAVLEASNGKAAIDLCAGTAEPVHLLLTDVVMPGMSGRELAGRLAQGRPEMKVVFMSGYSEEVIADQAALGIGAAFIKKPFSTGALARKVREVLDASPPPFNGR